MDEVTAKALNDWAAAYEKKHGHPPLIIGWEYEYVGYWFKLVECSELNMTCYVENRFGEKTTCDKSELSWKPIRPTLPPVKPRTEEIKP